MTTEPGPICWSKCFAELPKECPKGLVRVATPSSFPSWRGLMRS